MSKRSESRIFDERVMGPEPVVTALPGKSAYEVARIFNWYSYMTEVEECVSWITLYMEEHGFTKEQIRQAKAVNPKHFHSTVFWLSRLSQNGTVLGDEWENKLKSKILESLGHYRDEEPPVEEGAEKPPAPSVDRSKERIMVLIGDFEEILDSYLCGKGPKEPKSYEFFRKRDAKAGQVEAVRTYYEPLVKELADAVDGKDEDLVEAYSHMSKKQLKGYHEWVKQLVDGCKAFVSAVRNERPRTVRQKKAKPASELVKNVKYARGDEALKVSSVDPGKIIGAKTLYLYNTKYKKLQLYVSANDLGFSVKGTTIVNFDEKNSMEKTLRWPEKQLHEVLNGGFAAARKTFEAIKTSPGKLTGRINEHTVILRIDK